MITNILTIYIVYVVIVFAIILRVGHICHNSGNVYLAALMPQDVDFAIMVNKVLLIGYYLMNLGYALLMLKVSDNLYSMSDVVEVLAKKLAIIIMINTAIHYTNLLWMYIYAKSQQNKSSNLNNI